MMTIQQAFEIAVRHHLEGRLAEATALYQQIIAVQPGHVEAVHYLGVLMYQTGHLEQALALIQRALALAPNHAVAHMNLGNVLKDHDRFEEAITSYQRAIQLQPDMAEAHNNLGDILRQVDQYEESVAACREAIRLNPKLPEAWSNLAAVMAARGHVDEAEIAYRSSLQLRPDPFVHSGLLFTLLMLPRASDEGIDEELALWNEHYCKPFRPFLRPHTNDRDPERRLRIGYVSPDFYEHVVAGNILPLFKNHDHSRFEIVCFSRTLRPDHMTETFRRLSDGWWDTVEMDDETLAELVRRERIDVLVDLTQHCTGHRLLAFARKPAPVQVSYVGYPASTGLETIEYRISDRWLEGEGNKMADGKWKMLDRLEPTADGKWQKSSGDAERVFLLDSYWCYDMEGVVVPVSELPARTQGHITFGCLTAFFKMNESLVALWSRVLHRVPDSRFVLSSKSTGYSERILGYFERYGIDRNRIEFVKPRPRVGYLEFYHQLDLVLDAYPYNGHTTTMDTLWMGVPVVSLTGQPVVSRGGLSLLNNLGLSELVAHSEDEYVEIATRLAGDLDRLAELRENLRPRMEASVVMDGVHFTRRIEDGYRAMWREWCSGNPAS